MQLHKVSKQFIIKCDKLLNLKIRDTIINIRSIFIVIFKGKTYVIKYILNSI